MRQLLNFSTESPQSTAAAPPRSWPVNCMRIFVLPRASYSDWACRRVGWENGLSMLPYGERFRKTRKLVYEGTSMRAMVELLPLQEREVVKFVERLLRAPEQLREHIPQAIGSSLLKLTYGYNVEGANDPLILMMNEAMTMLSIVTTPGAWMVDTFPFSARWVEREVKAKDQEEEQVGDNELLIKWAGLAIVAAGTDTTASAVTTFFALMILHPEVQTKAQAELAQVIGNDRLPTYSDRDSLPYIEAVYKELLRWHPIAPIGVPHLSTANIDDEFRGMRIPKGSVVFGMIANMVRNPRVYRDPHVFNPDRFMGSAESLERNPEDIIFGFGRRRCPATYNITPAPGPGGKLQLPEMSFTNETIR
ncbi:hypothetical protein FRC11_008613 [Ceratobasidium sp. 423]|nr:hypothetical protein FRC11_008613 [Ceratobasidium sp. 423]